MLRSLALISAGLVLATTPVLARGHGGGHSSGSHSRSSGSHTRSGLHEHFANEVHQHRGGRDITIRPVHAKALHFHSKH